MSCASPASTAVSAATPTAASRSALSLDGLNDDVVKVLLSFLPPEDMAHLSGTCRRFHEMAKDPALWQELLVRDFRVGRAATTAPSTTMRLMSGLRSLTGRLRGDAAGAGAVTAAATGGAARSADWGGTGTAPVMPNNAGAAAVPASGPGTTVAANPLRAVPDGAPREASDVRVLDSPSYGTLSAPWLPREQARPSAGAPGGGKNSAFAEYVRLYKAHARERGVMRKRAEAATADIAVLRKRFRLRICLDCCQFGCGLGAYLWYIVLWLVLMLLKRGNVLPDMPWAAVFAPFIVAVIHPCAFFCLGACTVYASDRCSSRSAWAGQDEAEEYNLVAYAEAVADFDEGPRCCRRVRFPLLFVLWLCLLLTPILCGLKLDNTIAAGWGAVLTPVWLILFLLPCTPWTGLFPFLDDREGRRIFCGGFSAIVCLLLPLFVMTAVLLDGGQLRLVLVFIPLWIADTLLLFLACGSVVGGCCVQSASDRRIFRFIACGVLAVLALALGGQVPASLYWERGEYEAAAKALIIPALIAAVALALGGSVLAVVALDRARRKTFTALYKGRWRGARSAVAANMPGGHGVADAMRAVHGEFAATIRGS